MTPVTKVFILEFDNLQEVITGNHVGEIPITFLNELVMKPSPVDRVRQATYFELKNFIMG